MKGTSFALALFLLLTSATPASAQWAVFDPAALAQNIIIAERTLREYQQRVEQYLLLYRMARGLPGMLDYRVRAIVPTAHDVARFRYGAPLLTALNSGDPNGERYAAAVRPMAAITDRIPVGVRRALEVPFAAVEIADSVTHRAMHQAAMIRGASADMARAIAVLERDVTSSSDADHSMTVNLDKIAGAELIGRRQDSASNQLLSHVVEQQLVKTKRMRDAEAASMNMRLNAMTYGGDAQRAVFAGAAEGLRTWRQP
jgi:hypothetical protein